MRPAVSAALRYTLAILTLGLLGGIVLPVAGYLAGKRVIGAYEGRLGLRDYVDSIHTGLQQGEVMAWLIVLAPMLIAMVWYLVISLGRRLTGVTG